MKTIQSASVIMFLGIALGAIGAHLLEPRLAALGMRQVWETAVIYQLVHGLALFGLGIWESMGPGNTFHRVTARCWTFGVILFSGSLYLLALSHLPRWIGIITPIGGLLMLVGWITAFLAARRQATAQNR